MSAGGAAPPTDPTPLPWSTLDRGGVRRLRTAFGVCERAVEELGKQIPDYFAGVCTTA